MAIPASPQAQLDGIQVYRAPALVDDKAVGGSFEGLREERVVFSIEEGGSHTILGHRIHWFNLNTQTVETVDLPSRTLYLPGTAKSKPAIASEPIVETANRWAWGLAVLGVALGYLLIRWIRRTTGYRIVSDHLEAWRSHRRAKKAFMRAAAQQDSRRCLTLLYQRMSEYPEWQLSAACAADSQLRVISAALMAHAYSDGPPPRATEIQRLWDVCTTPRERQDKKNTLLLNPGPSP